MLDRPPTRAAVRARERRARLRDGVLHDLVVRVPTRRLVAAMKAANPAVGDLDTREAIEAELHEIAVAFMDRWLSPAKK